jgi:hypothetical protein
MTLIDGLLYHQRKFTLETPGGSTIRFAIEAVRDEAEPVKLYAVSPRERVLPKSQTGHPVSHWPHFWLTFGGLVAASLIAVGGIAVWYYQFR